METVQAFIERVFEDQYQTHFGPRASVAEQTDHLSLVRHDKEQLIAALEAKLVLENAHITALVVDEAYRGQGLVASLIAELEEILINRGIKSITLSTKSYQAEVFYKKLGYQVYGQLENVPQEGMTKYHLVKYMSQ